MNAPLVCGLLLAALTLRAAEPPPLADWMAALPDDTPLKSLAIPGAHNAATAGMPWFAACQDLPVPQLLEAGTRYLNLRVRLDGDGHPAFFHGPATGGRLEDLLRACAAFLAAHPRETLLLDFHHFRDGAEAAADARLRAILGNRLLHAPPARSPTRFVDGLTLGQARGKCLIFWGAADTRGHFARDDDAGRHPDRPLHSLYVAAWHTGPAERFLGRHLPAILARQANLPGLTVTQAQLTDGWGIRGPRFRDRALAPRLDALLRDWPHPHPNILQRDFVTPERNRLLLDLNNRPRQRPET